MAAKIEPVGIILAQDMGCPICDGFVWHTAVYHPAAEPQVVGSYRYRLKKVRDDVCTTCDDKLKDLVDGDHWMFGKNKMRWVKNG